MFFPIIWFPNISPCFWVNRNSSRQDHLLLCDQNLEQSSSNFFCDIWSEYVHNMSSGQSFERLMILQFLRICPMIKPCRPELPRSDLSVDDLRLFCDHDTFRTLGFGLHCSPVSDPKWLDQRSLGSGTSTCVSMISFNETSTLVFVFYFRNSFCSQFYLLISVFF